MSMRKQSTIPEAMTNLACDKTIFGTKPLYPGDYVKLDKNMYRVLECRSANQDYYEIDLELHY